MAAAAAAEAGVVRHSAMPLVAQEAGMRHGSRRRQRGKQSRQNRQKHALRHQSLHHRSAAAPQMQPLAIGYIMYAVGVRRRRPAAPFSLAAALPASALYNPGVPVP